mgnify:CR=1 FL=1
MGDSATTVWIDPWKSELIPRARYLVQTNGAKWQDPDLFVWTGSLVRLRLKFIRGCPIKVALILDYK